MSNIDGVPTCGICGGQLVKIRGRYPHEEKRDVCPTCLADRMDQIREISSPEYGKAYQAESHEPLKLLQEPRGRE